MVAGAQLGDRLASIMLAGAPFCSFRHTLQKFRPEALAGSGSAALAFARRGAEQ